jgi:hypothetical protein
MSRRDGDALQGPLIDAGLLPSLRAGGISFVKSHPVSSELGRGQMTYEYSIDRFQVYEEGGVYDRDLDLTWLVPGNCSLSWTEAMAAIADKSQLRQLLHGFPAAAVEIGWRLPTVEELMTLLTRDQVGAGFLEQLVLGELEWFWSLSRDEISDRAYYVEGIGGQVLRDAVGHRKGLVLCCVGLVDALGKLRKPPIKTRRQDYTDQVVDIHRIYSVYVRFVAGDVSSDFASEIGDALRQNGYDVSMSSDPGARLDVLHQPIGLNPRRIDYYVVMLDAPPAQIDLQILSALRTEFTTMLQNDRGIVVVHSATGPEMEEFRRTVGLANHAQVAYQYVRAHAPVAPSLIAALRSQIELYPREGWIPIGAQQALNSMVDEVNSTVERLERYEPAVLDILTACGEVGLVGDLSRLSVISSNQGIGSRATFASKLNRIEEFMTEGQGLPQRSIMYERLPGRFQAAPAMGNSGGLASDSYLKLIWWTDAFKYQTFEDALTRAGEVTEETGHNWRLPSANELITLIPRSRGLRKFMDEAVFPRGRWFWSSTCLGDSVAFVDYNYPVVGMEPRTASLAQHRRKSVLLVTDPWV